MRRVALALLLLARSSAADEPPPPPADQASGIVVADDPPSDRTAERVLLLVPRGLFWLVMQPIRGAVYVYEKYNLLGRFVDATFTDDRMFGAYPIATYQSTFGFTIGARLLYKDIFGAGERLRLRADYGGEFAYAVGGHFGTGRRLGGRVRVDLDTSLEQRPKDHFYGIGNGNAIATPPPMPIDPQTSDASIESRFHDRALRNLATVDVKLAGDLRTRVSGAWMRRELSEGDMDPIGERYDTSRLIGFASGVNDVYVEDELVYDSRRPTTVYATQALDATGWLVRAHFGIARGVGDDPTHYFAYGGEVQRYVDLWRGTHTLTLRAVLDAVGGTDGRSDGRISFIDLPRLGGTDDLRGYPTGRFRDKVVGLATAEYTWAIDDHASAYVFFDLGAPAAAVDELADGRLRFGYGGGLQLHTKHTFFTRLQVGHSRDGDTAFNLVFSPAFGRRERAGRF